MPKSKSNVIVNSLLEAIKNKDHKLYDVLRSFDTRMSDLEGISEDDALDFLTGAIQPRTYSNDGNTILTAATTNPTLGDSTLHAGYARCGPLVYVEFNYVYGSVGVAAGDGQYSIRLPVEAASLNGSLQASLYLAGTGSYPCTAYFTSSQTVSIWIHAAVAYATHNVPAAWTANSFIRFSGFYLATRQS